MGYQTRPQPKFRALEFGVSPRFNLTWEKWEEGQKKGDTDTQFDAYVNYWIARYMLSEELFASYGRENLQWGPSYLLSVSNPFNKANGRNNPKIEVPGLDFARAVWIPSYKWTVSFIANTGEGAADFVGEFDRAYAFKIDYTGSEKYFGLIPYYKESDDYPRVGFFGRWSQPTPSFFMLKGMLPMPTALISLWAVHTPFKWALPSVLNITIMPEAALAPYRIVLQNLT